MESSKIRRTTSLLPVLGVGFRSFLGSFACVNQASRAWDATYRTPHQSRHPLWPVARWRRPHKGAGVPRSSAQGDGDVEVRVSIDHAELLRPFEDVPQPATAGDNYLLL